MSASASGCKRPHTLILASAPSPAIAKSIKSTTTAALSYSNLPLALQGEVASFLYPHSLLRLSSLARWRSFYLEDD